MKLTRLITLSLAATFALAACGDKVKPDNADASLTDDQKAAKNVQDYHAKQAAFADSVLGNAKTAAEVAKKYGGDVQVGTVQMRDSITKHVSANPQCFKSGRDMDPYLAGTVTFYVHMSVVGSDVIRVQTSEWTSQAGNAVDKCFNELTPQWKLPMGLAKQGQYLLQIQFK